MRPTTLLPDDSALPGLAAIRRSGLAGAVPALDLEGEDVDVRLCGYTPGERATLEVRARDRHFAVKLYSEDPSFECALYETLAADEGIAGAGIRIPPLLTRADELCLFAIGWLEGPPATQLVIDQRGERAGELAAAWVRCASALPTRLGPPYGAARTVNQLPEYVALLAGSGSELRWSAAELLRTLEGTQPRDGSPHLVHGTLYARHVLDLGDGPGLIDWQRFGQGPLELDAGIFLATLSHAWLTHERRAPEAARATDAFLAGTAGLLDRRSLVWYWSAHLLRLAGRMLRRQPVEKARVVLAQAARLAEAA